MKGGLAWADAVAHGSGEGESWRGQLQRREERPETLGDAWCGERGRAGGRALIPSSFAACFLSSYSLCRVTAIIAKSIHGLEALGAEEMKRSRAIWSDGAFCLTRRAPGLCPPWPRFEVRNSIRRHCWFPEAGRPPLPSVLGRSIPGLTGKDSSFPLCLQLRPGRRISATSSLGCAGQCDWGPPPQASLHCLGGRV